MFGKTSAFSVILATNCMLAWAGHPLRVVPSGTIKDARQPQAAVTADGKIHVAFGAGNVLYCSTSSDSGKSFGKPALVGRVSSLSLGARRGPRVAASEKHVVMTAIGGERGGGKDGDVLAWRSTDGGKTWSRSVRVNDVAASAREGLHAMAIGPRGELFCVWIDLRNEASEVFGSGSDDGGKTWGKNQLIYRSPDGGICPCCHPAVTIDAKGAVHVMWRNALAGNRDMYVATSANGGRTFSTAQKLGGGSWSLDQCPMDGGYLAPLSPGKTVTVWMRQKQVFRVETGQQREEPLGPGEQPWVSATAEGAYIVWLDRRPGDVRLLKPGQHQPTTLAHHANDPALAAPIDGKGPVVAVWETGHRGDMTVMAAVVSDE